MAKDTPLKNNLNFYNYCNKSELLQLISLGQICSLLLHELCHPTQSALCKIKTIKKTLEQKPACSKKDVNQVETCLTCINNLLRFAQGKNKKIETVTLKQIVAQVINIVEYKAQMNQVDLINDCCKEIKFETNAFCLHLVLSNLILNSIEAYAGLLTDTKQKILINCQLINDRHQIQIKIRDWAEGIKFKDQTEVYQPFATNKNDQSHWGLGLTVSQQLTTNQLQGKLNCQSDSNGTCFLLKLPVELPA